MCLYAICKVGCIAGWGLYVCYVLFHTCDVQCTMCFMLCAEGNESIVQGLHLRLISPLSLTVSSPPVIYWMLSSKWTLSKNEIFQWWLLPFFSFEVDAINLNQLFVLDCSYHNLERGKQQMLKGTFWWILVLTSIKINGAERERNCVRVPDPRPV